MFLPLINFIAINKQIVEIQIVYTRKFQWHFKAPSISEKIKGRLFEKKHVFLRNNIWTYKAD